MKNELPEMHKRVQEIVCTLSGGIPLSSYDAEMEIIDTLCDDVLISIGCDISHNSKEIKKALRNMYFLGKIYEGLNTKKIVEPPIGSNKFNIEEND